jgi:hypothetical protein
VGQARDGPSANPRFAFVAGLRSTKVGTSDRVLRLTDRPCLVRIFWLLHLGSAADLHFGIAGG